MKQALDQAKSAEVLFENIDKRKALAYADHYRYLSYWYHIFLLRVLVLEKEFNKAIKVLEAALRDATYYRDSNREDDIFPNYYADFEDLQNEALLISATMAIAIDSDAAKSGELLKQWMNKSSARHLGSWRFNNVHIRYLVVSGYSGGCRPLIPEQSGHPFRYNPASDSGQSGHLGGSSRNR